MALGSTHQIPHFNLKIDIDALCTSILQVHLVIMFTLTLLPGNPFACSHARTLLGCGRLWHIVRQWISIIIHQFIWSYITAKVAYYVQIVTLSLTKVPLGALDIFAKSSRQKDASMMRIHQRPWLSFLPTDGIVISLAPRGLSQGTLSGGGGGGRRMKQQSQGAALSHRRVLGKAGYQLWVCVHHKQPHSFVRWYYHHNQWFPTRVNLVLMTQKTNLFLIEWKPARALPSYNAYFKKKKLLSQQEGDTLNI